MLTNATATYKVFLPAFVFTATFETVSHGLSENSGGRSIWVPIAVAFFIFLFSVAIAFPITLVLARGKEEAVKRVMWSCIVLGNWNTMALLVMQSLCGAISPLSEDPKCMVKSTGFASLYITVISLLTVSPHRREISSPKTYSIFRAVVVFPFLT